MCKRLDQISRRWSEGSFHQAGRSYSTLVEDVSGCLHREEDGSDLAKEPKDAMEAEHGFQSISGRLIHLSVQCHRKRAKSLCHH